MLNNQWEKNLKELLGEYKPEGLQPNWDEFVNQMDQIAELNNTGDDPAFDENLKESFKNYDVPGQDIGWNLIKASLDAADKEFDEDIRRRIAQFEPKYDPRTWPLFLQRLADSNFLRAKLIAMKIVEVAAVFLLLFTVVNLGRMGKLPFDTPLYNNANDALKPITPHDGMADNSIPLNRIGNLTPSAKNNQNAKITSSNKSNQEGINQATPNSLNTKTNTDINSFVSSGSVLKTTGDPLIQKSKAITHNSSVAFVDPLHSFAGINTLERSHNFIPTTREALESLQYADGSSADDDHLSTSVYSEPREGNINFIASLTSPVLGFSYTTFPHPTFVKQRKTTHTVFGILTQVDYNRLRMPEDRLSSSGRIIVFPQQGLPSYGYGGGFTIALNHPRWAVETGLIYNSKTFEPGRKLSVGTAFDNGTIEFEAMRLQLVTLPLQMRYKVENKGPIKFYALAGFDLNLIVQSDIDVSIKYHFQSLSINENPNSNPNLANTIKESRRVSEHIRDGAPFSTKSFVSAAAGLGLEYSLNEHKTFFIQAAAHYQIPNLAFSNNNGKHLRSISIQTGVRTPLGK
ncbi:MAG: hypothetical protein WBB31_05305 [Saprospiraceae bacterium]